MWTFSAMTPIQSPKQSNLISSLEYAEALRNCQPSIARELQRILMVFWRQVRRLRAACPGSAKVHDRGEVGVHKKSPAQRGSFGRKASPWGKRFVILYRSSRPCNGFDLYIRSIPSLVPLSPPASATPPSKSALPNFRSVSA
jgi:hypothetical protein